MKVKDLTTKKQLAGDSGKQLVKDLLKGKSNKRKLKV
jgi:hypothetical protein